MIKQYTKKTAKHILDICGLSASIIHQIKDFIHYNPIDSVKYGLLRIANKQFPDRKLFCPVPFTRMEIKRGGTTNLCGWLKRSLGNLHQESLARLWNSPVAREIRGSILDGTFRYCNLKVCPYFKSGKLPLQKDVFGNPYEDIIRDKCTKIDSMKLWLSFDHRCNIQCVSCRKYDVKLCEKEKAENQRIMASVKRDLDCVTTIGVCGKGEPFASPVIRDFLFNFDSAENPNLKIFILTNGQLLNRRCWEKMEKAHQAISSIQISIDAATKKHTKESGSAQISLH